MSENKDNIPNAAAQPAEEGFRLTDWIEAGFVEFDLVERCKTELDPLIKELVKKAEEIGAPLFVAVQVSQDPKGVGYSTSENYPDIGMVSAGMLALYDAMHGNMLNLLRVKAAEQARLERHGIIVDEGRVVH